MKRIARGLWRLALRLTRPVRRPILARVDARLASIVAGTVNARMMPPIIEALAVSGQRLERIEATLARADQSAARVADEVDLVLNGISREVFRLQAQVDALRTLVRDLATADQPAPAGFSIVAEGDDEAPTRRGNLAERSRVG